MVRIIARPKGYDRQAADPEIVTALVATWGQDTAVLLPTAGNQSTYVTYNRYRTALQRLGYRFHGRVERSGLLYGWVSGRIES